VKINIVINYVLKNKLKCSKFAAIALIIIIGSCVYVSGYLVKGDEIVVSEASAAETTETVTTAVEEKEIIIVVDVAGAVNNPGIVYLSDGSRVNDAVEKAGGLIPTADTLNVNLAAKLTDGDKVYIPQEGEEKKASGAVPAGIITSSVSNSSSGAASDSGGGLVNINTASSDQLQTLSGVGPATAQKIIDHRESSGGFKTIEDIMKVSGIGVKTFEKLRDKITV
jgi:competence protein ComEA